MPGKMPPEKGAGLIIGRFQPFHLGHLDTVRLIIRERGFAKIAIGSAQYSHTRENPFTAKEREMLIRAALSGIEAYRIYHVPDIHDNARWVGHVRSIVGEFSVLYTSNPLNERLFAEAGCAVVMHGMRRGVSGSRIRELMAHGSPLWKSLVPKQVAELLLHEHLASRIQGQR